MSFGGLILTNRGKNLQSKAQTGVALQYTRIGVGDGYLGTTPILDLNALKNQVKSLSITKLKNLGNGRAVVGTVLSNQSIAEGFYFREIGVFAQDPDLGEILYCYGNAGELAEYIAPGGGADIIEKNIDVQTIVGNAQNISAVIDESLVWETVEGSQEKANVSLSVAKDYTDQEIGGKTIDDTLIPSTDTGLSIKILLSWLANMIKSITGKTSWRTKPTRNMEELNTAISDVNATVGNKVDKVAGKQLSDTNYTIGEKMKLEGIESGANKYIHPTSHPASMITNLPTSLPANGGNADTVGGLAPSAFMNSINAGATDADPNMTAESFIITNHVNSPGAGLYWHILTTFYASKTSESNRGQLAISYNGSVARLMCRNYFAPTWTPWVELMPIAGGTFTGKSIAQNNTDYSKQIRNATLSTMDASGGASGDIWFKYKP